jgi:hypothetical protein
MHGRWSILSLVFVMCVSLIVLAVRAAVPAPPTVVVSVQAADTSGGVLHYRWRTTDGTIRDVNAPSTTWVLPNGPGLHFAYVLVSNGLGGYTERRVAVNTDTIGTPPKLPPPATLAAPPAPAQQGDYYRSFVVSAYHHVQSTARAVYATGFPAYLQDTSSGVRYPANANVLTDSKGAATIPNVPPGNSYAFECSSDGGITFSQCNVGANSVLATMLPAATSDYISTAGDSSALAGSLVLQDGSPCGTVNEFFGVRVTATATLRDAKHNTLVGPLPVNEFGDYSFPPNPNAASVLLKCESAKPMTINISGADLGRAVLNGVTAPNVLSMSAKLNGTEVGIFPPAPPSLPSDILTRADGFLAEKGVDSRLGACQYYRAVGAVRGCGKTGNLLGAISFEDWKRTVKIDNYATMGAAEYSATYINKMDLNLTRNHRSISYSPDNTAAYVCNHLGPAFSLVTTQQDIDTAIDNAVNGLNLVACVAMDYGVTTGVNNGQPFIRFLIFGPSGQLLPSINLDGRREKFVPGTCVVCHGGDHYAGNFPQDGSGFANVGGHFLPYDTGNFQFSSRPGLREADQEHQIYLLNQNVLNAGPTPAEQELIAGWYATGTVLNKVYVPPSYQDAQKAYSISSISGGGEVTVNTVDENPFVVGQRVTIAGVADKTFNGRFEINAVNSPTQFTYFSNKSVTSTSSGGTVELNPAAVSFYRNVLARACRSCHVAMIEGYNFDHYQNIAPFTYTSPRFSDTGFDIETNVCGGSAQIERDHMMPNSLVTFNRLWLTYKNPVGLPDQPAILNSFFGSDNVNGKPCAPGTNP